MSGVLGKGVRELKSYGKEAKSVLNIHNQLSRALGKPLPTSGVDKYAARMRAASKDTRAFTTEQSKLSRRLSQPISTKGLDSQIGKLREYRRELRGVERESERARTGMRGRMPGGRGFSDDFDEGRQRRRRSQQPRGFLSSMERADDFLQGTRQIGAAWRDRADSMRPYVDEATRLLRAQERFKVIGLSEGDNARAFAAVRQNVQDLKGITLADTTENVLDLVGALGNVDQAISALPLASKYKLGFETLFGDTFSRDQINEQVRSSFKFLELTGNTMKGAKQMEEMLNVITKIGASTGGRVSPNEILLMARRGNPAIQSLTPEGLRNISTLIEDMGAEQTGTALMSTYTALVGGVMKESATAEFGRLGLLDAGKFRVNRRTGLPSKILPGGNRLAPLFQEDPLKAADMLLAAMKSKGINTEDNKAVQAELQILFQNRNAFRMMNALTTQQAQIRKESGRAERSKGVTDIYEQLKDSPLMKFKEYEAAMTDFRASLGQGVLPMLTQFTKYATPIMRFFGSHPDVAQFAMKLLLVGKAGSGLIQTFAILKQTQALNMLVRARTDSLGAAQGLSAAEARAIGLKGKLGALSASPFIVTLQFLTVGFAIEKLFSLMDEVDQKKKLFDDHVKESSAAYDAWVSSRLGYTPKSTKEERDTLVNQVLARFNLGEFKTLEKALAPEKRAYGAYAWTGQRTYASRWSTGLPQYFGGGSIGADFRPDIAAEIFRQSGRELQDPFVLSRLLTRARRGEIDYLKVPKEEEERVKSFRTLFPALAKSSGVGTRLELFEQALQIAFPKSFGQASQLAEEEMKAVGVSSEQLKTSFMDMLNPAAKLPDALGRVGSAADSLALRLSSVQPVAPPLQGFFGSYQPPSPTPPPFSSAPFGKQPFMFPRSASGSIVEHDGLLYGHRGNAIFPASLSRQAPGDWLKSADAVREAISPDVLRSTAISEGSGQASFVFGDIFINVPAGSRAADDPEALGALVMAKIQEGLRAALPRHLRANRDEIDRIVADLVKQGREKAA